LWDINPAPAVGQRGHALGTVNLKVIAPSNVSEKVSLLIAALIV